MIWPLGGKLHQTVWTSLAPSPWRGFCLATPAPSAGSLPMPVGCSAVTQRSPLVWLSFPLSALVQGGGRLSPGGRKSKISQLIGREG